MPPLSTATCTTDLNTRFSNTTKDLFATSRTTTLLVSFCISNSKQSSLQSYNIYIYIYIYIIDRWRDWAPVSICSISGVAANGAKAGTTAPGWPR